MCTKDKGAEFPKKPHVQNHTKSLCVAANDARSRRDPRLHLEEHSQVGKREAEMLKGAFQTPGRLQSHSSERVSSCKRSSKKNHPYRTCTREPLFQHHFQGASLYPAIFHAEEELGSCHLLSKHPRPAESLQVPTEQHLSPGVAGHSPLPPALPIPTPASSCLSPGFHSFGLGWRGFLRFPFLLAQELLLCDGLLHMGSIS